MRKIACGLAVALALSACGGGGGGSSTGSSAAPVAAAPVTPAAPATPSTPASPATPVVPSTPAAPASPLDAYVGTWVSDCIGHAIYTDTITKPSGSTNTLTISEKRDYYSKNNCTGKLLATLVPSTPLTATHAGTVTETVVINSGDEPLPQTIDKVNYDHPAYHWTISGTGYTETDIPGAKQWTISYEDDNFPAIYESFEFNASHGSGAYYLKGTRLHQLRSTVYILRDAWVPEVSFTKR